ncbi:MAG: hypothetical protein BWY68_00589 [bacterium ADurb.Bin400]|nr:MAG: hypothetical protein BWY68_00589 [bacterium ADurb.Bin400]
MGIKEDTPWSNVIRSRHHRLRERTTLNLSVTASGIDDDALHFKVVVLVIGQRAYHIPCSLGGGIGLDGGSGNLGPGGSRIGANLWCSAAIDGGFCDLRVDRIGPN